MLVGMELFSSLIKSGDVVEMFSLNLKPEMFKPSEEEVYNYICNHVKKYGVFPKEETLATELDFEVGNAPEPPKFYADKVKARFVGNTLLKTMKEAEGLIAGQDPYEAVDALMQAVVDMTSIKYVNSIFDFREAASIIKEEYIKQLTSGDEHALMSGWKTLDTMSGGLIGGDVLVDVGRPAMGKTWKLLYQCLHGWKNQGRRPLFISMEMKPTPITQRLAAMYTSTNLTQIKTATLSTKAEKGMIKELTLLNKMGEPLWIVDGKLALTVEDIWALCLQLKPDCVFIDGAYMLKANNPRLARWEKVTQTVESAKEQLAMDLDVPVILSYQLNRDSLKKKKDEVVGLEDIAGADAIGQIATIVLGLLEDDSVETLKRRLVSILKGRNGESGRFHINWDFYSMDFSEWKEQDIETLQYI